MTELIINRPDLQTFQQKYGQSIVTVLFWTMFFFFMRPLVGMVGWFFGLQLFTDVMIVQGGYEVLLDLLLWYFGVIVLMGLTLEGWALYNLLRYGRHEKRLHQPLPITVDAQSTHFQIDADLLRRLQISRRVVLEHDERGRLVNCRAESQTIKSYGA